MIAKIAVSAAVYAIDKPYSYAVPPGMTLLPGVRVMVPFGRGNRNVEGVVLSLEEGNEAELQCVDRALDPEPVAGRRQVLLRLAAFVRERATSAPFMRPVVAVPSLWACGTRFRIPFYPGKRQTLGGEDHPAEGTAEAVLAFLEDLGARRPIALCERPFREREALQAALRYLLNKKWLTSQSDFLRRSRRQDRARCQSSLRLCRGSHGLCRVGRPKSAPLQASVLELLCTVGSCAVKELCYYTGATAATVRRLEKLGYVSLQERPVLRCREIVPGQAGGPLDAKRRAERRPLTSWRGKLEVDRPGVALLHGVTGSGKDGGVSEAHCPVPGAGKGGPAAGAGRSPWTPQLLSLLAAHFGRRMVSASQQPSHQESGMADQWEAGWERPGQGGGRYPLCRVCTLPEFGYHYFG